MNQRLTSQRWKFLALPARIKGRWHVHGTLKDEWKAIKSHQDKEYNINRDTEAENQCRSRNKDKFNKFKQW